MRTSHLPGLVAASAFALLAPNAAAFTDVTVGDPVIAELQSSTIAIGSFSSCTGSTMGLTVTQDAGPGAGGMLEVHDASFSGCTTLGSPATFTPDTSTPWPITFDSAGRAVIQGFNFTQQWGALTCHFSGAISGDYNQNTGNMTLAGTLTKQSGSFLCPSSPAIQGTYHFTDAETGDPVQL